MGPEHFGRVFPSYTEKSALLQPREKARRARAQAKTEIARGRLQPDGEGQDARRRIVEQLLDGGELVVRTDPDEIGQHDIAVLLGIDAAGAVIVRQQRRREQLLQRAHKQKIARIPPHRQDGIARIRRFLQDRAAVVQNERPFLCRLHTGRSALRPLLRDGSPFCHGRSGHPASALHCERTYSLAHRQPSSPFSLRRNVSRSNSQ